MLHSLPPLPYSYSALKPFIDAETVEIHYTKHHQNYLNNLNSILEKYPEIADRFVPDLLINFDQLNLPAPDQVKLRNNAGGFLNHNLYWEIMGPQKEINEVLVDQIKAAFGSLDEFKKIFTQTAKDQFGSGWAWLVQTPQEKLEVYSLPNQDSPYLKNHVPLIGLDVWEHAYYLKYQNDRAAYIDNWWHVLKLLP